MTDGAAVLTRREAAVLRVTLNRPEKRNALDESTISGLKAALREAESDPGIRVVSVEGAGKDFCAGADLAAMQRLASATAIENLADAESLGELFLQLRRLPKPVVAIVRGRALAGGCGLATACDLVVAAESASFGYPEVGIGFVPAMVMAMLRRNVGEKRAFELVCLGRTITAAEAEQVGLINRTYPDAELEAGSRQQLDELADRSATALQLSKRLLYRMDALSFEEAVRAGGEVNALARITADARAGIGRFAGRSTAAE